VEDLEEVLGGGKPRIVVAIEDAVQRMEQLAKAEPPPLRDRRPVTAAVVTAITVATCVILFTFAMPGLPTGLTASMTVGEDPLLREAAKAMEDAEEFARAHPAELEAIRKAFGRIRREYPEPYPTRAGVRTREHERHYEELSREKARTLLTQCQAKRDEGDPVGALLCLYDIGDQWLHGAVGNEVRHLRESLQADIRHRLGMVLVPGGEFLAGKEKRTEHLPPFLIDTTEVTNAAYREFVSATGHPPPAHWHGGEIPSGDEELPVVGVTYDDAVLYAIWAGKRIPTAPEWEKAARGTDGRAYPWGDEFVRSAVNCRDPDNSLSPARSFPGGVSPYGCLNMAGNAHEWTSSQAPGAALRIVKGGAHRSYPTNARTFSELAISPDHSDPHLPVGFRCVKDVR
jgi:formylglycine-generating enzyme required for sulfatase activity